MSIDARAYLLEAELRTLRLELRHTDGPTAYLRHRISTLQYQLDNLNDITTEHYPVRLVHSVPDPNRGGSK